MKKILRVVSLILLIISILNVIFIVMVNLTTIIRIMFLGMTVGNTEYPDSIWWGEQTLYGVIGVKTYYSTIDEIIMFVEVPFTVLSIIYQLLYFKIIKKIIYRN